MYKYKSELLKTDIRWVSDKLNEKDAKALDEFLNKQAEEGWELVTYNYMSSILQFRGDIIITFRKKID